ncbi:uncharacterized protein TNCV_1893941 [Trichonephila clavipes]|nr:uncharacterized protein TNCV_1893941 [Trichonephila clavipes]
MWEAPHHSQESSLIIEVETSPNRTVTCMVLKATVKDMRHLALCHDEYLGFRTGGISNNNNKLCIPLKALKFTCRNCGGGDRGRVAIYRPFGEVSVSLNRTVTCMVLKANDRRTSCPCHDEFRGPRSDYVRQVALATTTTKRRDSLQNEGIHYKTKGLISKRRD